jgi:hypothetical protein
MGKPHCNSSIRNFRFCTRFKVNFAYAEFHSWHSSPGSVFHPSATYIGQFDKLTDHTGARSLSLPKGPFLNRIFIPSLTHPALKSKPSLTHPALKDVF